MPAPSVLVIFEDSDGDEFPVKVPGQLSGSMVHLMEIAAAARSQAEGFVKSGEFRPNGELLFIRAEQLNAR